MEGGEGVGLADAEGALVLTGALQMADEAAGVGWADGAEDGGPTTWTLGNASADVASVGCESGWRAFPILRVEALQGDGDWQERYANFARPGASRGGSEVWPEQTATLGDLAPLHPGTYRVIARTEGPGGAIDVVREVAVVGWSAETVTRGQALVGEAEAAQCSGVATMIAEGLRQNAEPDIVLDLLAAAEETAEAAARDLARDPEGEAAQEAATEARYERWWVMVEMLERGIFVAELGAEVERMALDDAIEFAARVSRGGSERHQPRLRRAIADRLLAPFVGWQAPLQTDLLQQLAHFEDQWPAHARETLVARLEEGPEAGAVLSELIDVIVYASREIFEADSPKILRALRSRCAGAADPTLVASCERGISSFSPGFHGGFCRGSGSSWGCGVGWGARRGICAELHSEWQALVEEVGAPRTIFLGASVEAVPGEDLAEDAQAAEAEDVDLTAQPRIFR